MFKVGDVLRYFDRDDQREFELTNEVRRGRGFIAVERFSGITREFNTKYLVNHMIVSGVQYLPYSHRS